MRDFESYKRRPMRVDLPSSTLPQVLKRRMSTGSAALLAAGDGRWEIGDGDRADMKRIRTYALQLSGGAR
jgi:hypothetical protein